MMRKIILTALCLSLCAALLPGTAHSFENAVDECYERLIQKYPNQEAVEERFGSGPEWRRTTEPSPHDPELELKYNEAEYPGINILTMGYELEGESRFFILLLDVEKAGLVDLSGVDIGSAKAEVIKIFGEPYEAEGNELRYTNEVEYVSITFVIEKNKVKKMTFRTYVD